MSIKITFVVLAILAIASCASDPDKGSHPIMGKWTWTLPDGCKEVYELRADYTRRASSGEERSTSNYSISAEPEASGFYRMTDEITASNGKTSCGGPAASIGEKLTSFIFIRPGGDEFLACATPSLDACLGPLRRIKSGS